MTEGEYPTRRQYPRHKVTAFIDYAGNGEFAHRVENISLGGVCIHTAVLEEVGTTVDIVIKFPSLDAKFTTEGEVAWVNADELGDMGIRFIGLDAAARQQLQQLIDETREED